MKQCVYQVFQFIWHYWMMYKECYAGRQCVQPVWLPTHLHKVRLSDAEKKNFPRTSSVPPACNRHRRSRRNTDERFVLCFGIAKWNFGDTFVIQLPKSRVKRHMNSFWFIGDALPLKLWDSRCQVESIWCRASANKWRHPREKTHRAYSQVWMPTYIPTSQKGEV